MTVPDTFVAGDTLEFGVNVPDYLPADGWTLKYRFVARFTSPVQAAIELTATAGPVVVNDETFDYAVTSAPATTANWAPGAYNWFRWAEKSGARQTLRDADSYGVLTILQNPATAAQGHDGRSQAQKALQDAKDALENLLAGGASSGMVIEVRIGDRSTKYGTPEEARAALVKSINYWQAQVDNERARDRLAQGLSAGSGLQVRF